MPSPDLDDFFHKEHERLDSLYHDFRTRHDRGAKDAADWFREFRAQLELHLTREEKILFPVFEKWVGLKKTGVIEEILEAHKSIQAFVKVLARAVEEGAKIDEEDEREFLRVLGEHSYREEEVVYTILKEFIDSGARKELAASMAAFRESVGK